MNTEQLTGQWKQIKGAAKQKWGKLTDDDLNVINGQRDILIGKLQERYGFMKEEAREKADEFLKTFDHKGEAAAAGLHNEPGKPEDRAPLA